MKTPKGDDCILGSVVVTRNIQDISANIHPIVFQSYLVRIAVWTHKTLLTLSLLWGSKLTPTHNKVVPGSSYKWSEMGPL